MIPIKLAVRNFMPYGDNVPALHFSGIHVASICGNNGNGKSALIDAMTWALWGKTRAKSDDDLIHLGQTEMAVEFDFAVGQQAYRVIRKHAKPKRRRASGQSSLDLLIASGDGFKVISGDGIRQTEQKIVALLHMDYDTFINSAFLRQGHADEFTQKPPGKRKEDELEEQARELAKQQETEKALAESAIKDISDELARKPTYEAELAQAQNQLSSVDKVISQQESGLNELRQKKELLKNKQWQLAQLEEHLAETARALARWDAQSQQHHAQIKEYEELIAQRAAIEDGYAQFTGAKKLKDELDQKLRLSSELNEGKHRLEMTIVRASQALLKEHALAENKIGELEASRQKVPQFKNEWQQVQTELGRLAEEEETLRQQRQSSQELRTQVHALESSQARLEEEIAEIAEKLNLLLGESGAKCPLCETELGSDGLKLIETKYTAAKHGKADSLKSAQSELAQQNIELRSIESEISRVEARLKQDRTSAQSKISLISREIDQAELAGNQLSQTRKLLAEIEERLAKKDFAISEQAALQQLDGELGKLNYDSQQHEQLRHRLTSLEQYENPKRRLVEADRLINQAKEAAARAEQAAQELGHSLEADNQKGQELTLALSSLPQLVAELARAEAEHQILSRQQKQAQEIVGSVKGKLERCAELEIKRGEKAKSLAQAAREEKIYRELAQAFGKGGIQALLIDSARPEIEAEANKLHRPVQTTGETGRGTTAHADYRRRFRHSR
ncbi:MAG: SMC family ATPase [Chloroflexi bacterium]|nr:SMC family ATPase [Chloroflexota bacterium]